MAIPGRAGDLWPAKAPEWEVSGSPRLNLARGTVQAEETAWKGIGGQLLAGPGKLASFISQCAFRWWLQGKGQMGREASCHQRRGSHCQVYGEFFFFNQKHVSIKRSKVKIVSPPSPAAYKLTNK